MALKEDEIARRAAATYDAEDMTVLEGLEPVRKRPGMYIGSTGPTGLHHLVWEVVDNSVDEAMAGYCTQIDVTLLADGGCRVTDNGRGIPTDVTRSTNLSARRDRSHQAPWRGQIRRHRLQGLGRSARGRRVGRQCPVDAASSSRSTATASTTMEFANGRQARREAGGGRRRVATVSRDRDDGHLLAGPDHLRRGDFRAQTVSSASRCMAFLNTGLEINFRDEREGRQAARSYCYKGGIIDFVKHLNATKDPLFRKVAYFEQAEETMEVEVALQWNTGLQRGLHGFANGIATIEGGTHVEGLKKGLTNVVNKYARARSLLKEKDENLLGEDIREGMCAIVSVKLRDPQFEGQTKAKLGNTSIRSLVERATNEKLAEWLEENPPEASQIVQQGHAGRPGPGGRPGRPRPDPAQVGARRRRPARQAHRLLVARPAGGRAVHRRGQLGRRLGQGRPQPARPRPSCPSAARSSTSSGPASTRC